MKPSACFKHLNRRLLKSQNQVRAFTLIEMFVVITVIALLSVILLPVLAATVKNAARAQCAANLHQIGVETMMYANDNNTWLPICGNNEKISIRKVNVLNGLFYTRYVWTGYYGDTWNWNVSTSASATHGGYENLGYLLKTRQDANGKTFYCPAQWGSPIGESSYMPFLTCDAGGVIRSSYAFNPRTIGTGGTYEWLRRYQKTTQFEAHKLLAVDYLGTNYFAHIDERGWNVLFTDGSVNFSRNEQAYNLNQKNIQDRESVEAHVILDQIFNYLELDYDSNTVTVGIVQNNASPVFLSVNQTPGMLAFTWSAVINQKYQVQYCTNLSEHNWNNLGGLVTATNATITTIDSTRQDPQRFYRVIPQ